MEYLNWMAEHWLLTIVLLAIVGQTLIGMCWGLGGRRK